MIRARRVDLGDAERFEGAPGLRSATVVYTSGVLTSERSASRCRAGISGQR